MKSVVALLLALIPFQVSAQTNTAITQNPCNLVSSGFGAEQKAWERTLGSIWGSKTLKMTWTSPDLSKVPCTLPRQNRHGHNYMAFDLASTPAVLAIHDDKNKQLQTIVFTKAVVDARMEQTVSLDKLNNGSIKLERLSFFTFDQVFPETPLISENGHSVFHERGNYYGGYSDVLEKTTGQRAAPQETVGYYLEIDQETVEGFKKGDDILLPHTYSREVLPQKGKVVRTTSLGVYVQYNDKMARIYPPSELTSGSVLLKAVDCKTASSGKKLCVNDPVYIVIKGNKQRAGKVESISEKGMVYISFVDKKEVLIKKIDELTLIDKSAN